mmetsp:Transcript_58136/g.184992  ORF Transcript_58136/g.184992 Transcript_58136/m.184992 type:complete len:314 (-) Transcript_58136:235-1176(-)
MSASSWNRRMYPASVRRSRQTTVSTSRRSHASLWSTIAPMRPARVPGARASPGAVQSACRTSVAWRVRRGWRRGRSARSCSQMPPTVDGCMVGRAALRVPIRWSASDTAEVTAASASARACLLAAAAAAAAAFAGRGMIWAHSARIDSLAGLRPAVRCRAASTSMHPACARLRTLGRGSATKRRIAEKPLAAWSHELGSAAATTCCRQRRIALDAGAELWFCSRMARRTERDCVSLERSTALGVRASTSPRRLHIDATTSGFAAIACPSNDIMSAANRAVGVGSSPCSLMTSSTAPRTAQSCRDSLDLLECRA